MRQTHVTLILAASLTTTSAYAQRAEQQPAVAEFEVQVAGKSYQAKPGVPLRVKTPKGERIAIVVRHRETIHYAAHGLAFDYPRQMKVSTETSADGTTVTAQCPESLLLILQTSTAGATPTEVQASLLEEPRKAHEANGCPVEEGKTPVRRKIGTVEREGRALSVKVGDSQFVAEVYAFTKGRSVLSVLLQHDVEDAALMARYSAVILRSLR